MYIWPWKLHSELCRERERREQAEAQLARLRRAVADLPAVDTPHRRQAGLQLAGAAQHGLRTAAS